MVLLDGRGDGVPAGGNDVFSGSASNAGWDSSPAAAPAADLDDDIPFYRFIFDKRGSAGTSFFWLCLFGPKLDMKLQIVAF